MAKGRAAANPVTSAKQDSFCLRLTVKQEAFCLAYLTTGNASEAYRMAYDAEKMKPEVVWKEASVLLGDRKVTVRIAELRREAAADAKLTLVGHLHELERLKAEALARKNASAAIRAEELRGRASGLYVEQVEVGAPGDYANLTEAELDAREKAIDERLAVINAASKRREKVVKRAARAK